MLNNYQLGLVAFTWGQFHRKCTWSLLDQWCEFRNHKFKIMPAFLRGQYAKDERWFLWILFGVSESSSCEYPVLAPPCSFHEQSFDWCTSQVQFYIYFFTLMINRTKLLYRSLTIASLSNRLNWGNQPAHQYSWPQASELSGFGGGKSPLRCGWLQTTSTTSKCPGQRNLPTERLGLSALAWVSYWSKKKKKKKKQF